MNQGQDNSDWRTQHVRYKYMETVKLLGSNGAAALKLIPAALKGRPSSAWGSLANPSDLALYCTMVGSQRER